MIDVRAATAWRRAPVALRDLPLAVVFAAAPWVPALQEQGTRLGEVPQRPVDALAALPVALLALPLAVRRVWPAATLALVGLGFAVDQLAGYATPAGLALPVALVSAGAHVARHRRAVVVLATAGYVALAVALHRRGGEEDLSGYVVFFLLLAAAWGVGVWLRQSRAAEAERRRHVAQTTRLAERTRLARDLHDVVTHHVTAMVVQAEAARYLTAHPDRLDDALAAVTDTGRRALTDLRQVLDLLDPAADPSAGPGDDPAAALADLVERTRRAGQPVEHVTTGAPRPLPDDVAAAVHRVVQEGLTNALKHAPGRRTVVHVRYTPHALAVEVVTHGEGSHRSPGAPSSTGGGRGLVGLRARVTALGGDLTAGPDDGAFVLRAHVPLGSAW